MEAGAGRSGAFHVVGSAAQLAPEAADAELRRLQQEVGPSPISHMIAQHLWSLYARTICVVLPKAQVSEAVYMVIADANSCMCRFAC